MSENKRALRTLFSCSSLRATCKGAWQSSLFARIVMDCFVAGAPRNDGELKTVLILLVIARFMRAIQPLGFQAILSPKDWITRTSRVMTILGLLQISKGKRTHTLTICTCPAINEDGAALEVCQEKWAPVFRFGKPTIKKASRPD